MKPEEIIACVGMGVGALVAFVYSVYLRRKTNKILKERKSWKTISRLTNEAFIADAVYKPHLKHNISNHEKGKASKSFPSWSFSYETSDNFIVDENCIV